MTKRRFRKLCISTLVAIYFLILVGGVVRSTGSGMGCPDWPKCFGHWIPPSSIDQLPADYKQIYASVRQDKNRKFARYLQAVGFRETAARLLGDKSVLTETQFDPVKSWIEYLNRVVGVVIGFFIIALVYRSLTFRKTDPKIFWVSVATLIAVILQGWFGSIVVSTNLTSWTVTLHMFLAMGLVAMLVYLIRLSGEGEFSRPDPWLRLLCAACMLALLVQIFLGTQVRAAIDQVAALTDRPEWIRGAGSDFTLHRSFSWTVLILHAVLIAKLRKTALKNPLSLVLILLILGTFSTGIGMAYWAVPAWLQPLHLLFATMTFGAGMMMLLNPSWSAETKLQLR